MAVKEILLLGNPGLYKLSDAVGKGERETIGSVVKNLHDTMMAFRNRHGVGRAIAAPQIGVHKRLIYMNVDSPVVFINPVIIKKSDEMIELWDDCMSFPDLLVKVRRHKFITVEYRDVEWNEQELHLFDDLSELLQHENDHLDGILAIHRAINGQSFALKSQREFLDV